MNENPACTLQTDTLSCCRVFIQTMWRGYQVGVAMTSCTNIEAEPGTGICTAGNCVKPTIILLQQEESTVCRTQARKATHFALVH